jgi:hypothetical protein
MGRYDAVRPLEGQAMMYRHDTHRQDRASHIPICQSLQDASALNRNTIFGASFEGLPCVKFEMEYKVSQGCVSLEKHNL